LSEVILWIHICNG